MSTIDIPAVGDLIEVQHAGQWDAWRVRAVTYPDENGLGCLIHGTRIATGETSMCIPVVTDPPGGWRRHACSDVCSGTAGDERTKAGWHCEHGVSSVEPCADCTRRGYSRVAAAFSCACVGICGGHENPIRVALEQAEPPATTTIARCGCPESLHLRAALDRIGQTLWSVNDDEVEEDDIDAALIAIADAALALKALPPADGWLK